MRFDLRYDDYNQDQLRSGTGKASAENVALPNAQEIQHDTHNRITTVGVDYSPSYAWGFSLQVPWVSREHDTYAATDTALSTSDISGLGDLRLLARYQGAVKATRGGILFGVKLPTGNTSATFQSGPAAGEPLDRGLQSGTGTTDLLLGAYRYGAFNNAVMGDAIGWFVQAQIQAPLDSRAGFRPGDALTVSGGMRWLALGRVVPQLQLNDRVETREAGPNADVDNSGAHQLFVSPGIDWQINSRLGAFAFIQLPLYQDVNGIQLEPTGLMSAGLHYRL